MSSEQPPHEGVITTSTAVEQTYYGLPVIKGAHWRWLVINYFFLAALTGTSAAIATLADLVSRDRALVRTGRYLSLATALPAPLLLTLDLGRPERAFHMFRILKLKSPMSLGSWALLCHGVFTGASAGAQLLADVTRREVLVGPRRVLGILGLPFALFVSGYTGVLLAATNVPLWARNALFLGPTFITSAFSSGLSALSLLLRLGGKERAETARGLARAETICLATELSLLLGSIMRLGKLGRPLTTGTRGGLFWLVTIGGGVLTPLALQLSGPAHGKEVSHTRRTGAALAVLLGGYVLRTLMIFAGAESANRPEDYFAYTGRPAARRMRP